MIDYLIGLFGSYTALVTGIACAIFGWFLAHFLSGPECKEDN